MRSAFFFEIRKERELCESLFVNLGCLTWTRKYGLLMSDKTELEVKGQILNLTLFEENNNSI